MSAVKWTKGGTLHSYALRPVQRKTSAGFLRYAGFGIWILYSTNRHKSQRLTKTVLQNSQPCPQWNRVYEVSRYPRFSTTMTIRGEDHMKRSNKAPLKSILNDIRQLGILRETSFSYHFLQNLLHTTHLWASLLFPFPPTGRSLHCLSMVRWAVFCRLPLCKSDPQTNPVINPASKPVLTLKGSSWNLFALSNQAQVFFRGWLAFRVSSSVPPEMSYLEKSQHNSKTRVFTLDRVLE